MRGTRSTASAVVGLVGAAALLTGCAGGAGSLAGDESTGEVPVGSAAGASAPANGTGAMDEAGSTRQVGGAGTLSGISVERSVIAVADLTLRTPDVAEAVSAVKSVAVSLGGYVSSQDVAASPDDPESSRATVQVRVPTARLDTAVARLQDAGDVVRLTSDVQDVTEQVVDVDSRVASARASVERIRALLSQATTIGDVVRIESELARREADLESLLAQQRALSDQTSMATLTVTLLAPAAVEPPPADEDGFLPGLERGWQALVDVVVVGLTTLGVLLPFLVVAALVIGPLAAAWQRHRRRTAAQALAAPPAAALAQTAEPPSQDPPGQEREHEPVG